MGHLQKCNPVLNQALFFSKSVAKTFSITATTCWGGVLFDSKCDGSEERWVCATHLHTRGRPMTSVAPSVGCTTITIPIGMGVAHPSSSSWRADGVYRLNRHAWPPAVSFLATLAIRRPSPNSAPFFYRINPGNTRGAGAAGRSLYGRHPELCRSQVDEATP